MFRLQSELRALLGLAIVLDQDVGHADSLDAAAQTPIRHELYDRRTEPACERVLF
jgi:hypothetical protein